MDSAWRKILHRIHKRRKLKNPELVKIRKGACRTVEDSRGHGNVNYEESNSKLKPEVQIKIDLNL